LEDRTSYDYVHFLVDDPSRLAYSEILTDEIGTTCAAFLLRAVAYFAAHGIPRIEQLGDLRPTQTRHPAGTVSGKSHLFRAEPSAAGGQKVTDLGPVIHALGATTRSLCGGSHCQYPSACQTVDAWSPGSEADQRQDLLIDRGRRDRSRATLQCERAYQP
jgi:hypothetical protein